MKTYQEGYTSLNTSSTTSSYQGRCPWPLQFIVEPRSDCRLRQWFIAFSVLLVLHLYYNMNSQQTKYIDISKRPCRQMMTCGNVTPIPVYKYPLINSSEVVMTLGKRRDSAYSWFETMRDYFVNIGKDEEPSYVNSTRLCVLYISTLEPILIDRTESKLEWVEQYHSDVKLGGFHAPTHCRSKYRVAIFVVPCRAHRRYFGIFLYYLHRLLKKQLMEYRVFFIEPYAIDKMNKGVLYNIAYLESQRFGTWDCLIFHEVDLIPLHERIIYGCSNNPIHLSPAVEYGGFVYVKLFGGVTALTPEQYENVNGYSNLFWNLEGVDNDMKIRLLTRDYAITQYNASVAIYASLTHHEVERERVPANVTSRHQYYFEGLSKTKYSLVNVTKQKLYTHIIANISPDTVKLYPKSNSKRSSFLNFRKLMKS